MGPVDAFSFLLGSWRVERSLEDHLSGRRVWFDGVALVKPQRAADPAGAVQARYEEAGELRIGAYRGRAERRLDYLRLTGTTVGVCFTDGRPFIDLDLRTGVNRSTHQCGDDHYGITTLIRSCDVLEERWRVRGPTKDYDAVATLARRDDGSHARLL